MIGTKTTLSYFLKSTIFIFILFIPMKTSIYQISFFILVISFFTYLFYYKKWRNLKNIFLLYKEICFGFGLVILSMLISNILSHVVTIEAWFALMQYIGRYFLFFWILIFFYAEKIISKQFVLMAILVALLIQGIDGLNQLIFGIDLIKSHIGSISEGLSGSTDNRNVFGFFMAIGASISSVILFNYSINESKKMYLLFIVSSLIVFILDLLFSYSRSAWLFYGIFIALYTIRNLKYMSFKKVIFLFFMIALIGIAFLSFSTLTTRFCELVAMNSSQRDIIWIDAIRLIKENFLFGYGLMAFKQISSQPVLFVHNSFLEVFLCLGLVGFATFTNLLFIILKEVIKYKNSIYLSFFFAFLIITQFDHSVIKGITSLSTLAIFAFFIFVDRLKSIEN